MSETRSTTKLQMSTLAVLRILIGWHLLFEGISKLMNPNWSSLDFLNESQWIMEGFANWVVSNSGVMSVVDFLNTWGLIAIGVGLIVGLFTRVAAFSGAFLLLMYYFNNAPIIGIEYSMPSEGHYLIVSKTLIESVALIVISVFPTGSFIGLDIYVERLKSRKKYKKVQND